MEKKKGYSMFERDKLDPADSMRIERNIYFEEQTADLSGLTALPLEQLQALREEYAAAEQAAFEALQEQAAAWDEQAGKTLAIDKAIEYVRTPEATHTANQWEATDYGKHISNRVYQMRYHISENTRYDREKEKSIPYSWTLSWSIYTNSPHNYGQAKIAGQERKVFADKAAMEKYLNGRIKAYQHLFTEVSPPIPPEYAEHFKVNGQLLPGYAIEGDVKQLYAKAQETAQTTGQDKDTFSIYQIKGGDETRDFRFEPYDRLQAAGNVVDKANYELVYSAPLAPETSLEDIYTRFNIDHPKDFKGHSLSVSDVVVLHQNGQDTAHYVDSVGFRQVPEFLQEQKQLTPDELTTGETIQTPRGTFHVTAMSREQIEAAGYGFHHQSDDGKYLIMGNGTRAFAVAAEQPEKANPLKHIEDTVEQNDNNFDGIINNTPTVDELEAKVKAGETISLVDLANAVKADKERGKEAKPEKKPSIRAQLRADKEKAQKKNAKQKLQDLERS